MTPTVPVGVSRPAPTVTQKAGGQWRLRSDSQAKATVRRASEAAPTLFFGNASCDMRWEADNQQWEDSIPITLEEASVLQSFPADYPWQGTKTAKFQQVGNAIPPVLARAILTAIVAVVDEALQ